MKRYRILNNSLDISNMDIHGEKGNVISFITSLPSEVYIKVYTISDKKISCYKYNDGLVINGFSDFEYKSYMNNKLHLYDHMTTVYNNKVFDESTYKFPENSLGFKFITINNKRISLYHSSGMYLSLYVFNKNYCCQVNKYESL